MNYMKPIEFNAVVQRTQDVATMKQNQDQKPVQDQTNIQQTVQKNVEHATKEVIKKDNADYSQQNYDAKEKGKNEYQALGKRKRSQKQEDRVVHKSAGGFDIKV